MEPQHDNLSEETKTKRSSKTLLRLLSCLGFVGMALLFVCLNHYWLPVLTHGSIVCAAVSVILWRALFADATKTFAVFLGVTVLFCTLFWVGLNVTHTYSGQTILWHFEPSFEAYSWNAKGCDESSTVCKMKGLCGFENHKCVLTQSGCENAMVCSIEGRCGLGKEQCVPTPKGCAKAYLCEQLGRCSFKKGVCVE